MESSVHTGGDAIQGASAMAVQLLPSSQATADSNDAYSFKKPSE